MGFAEHMAQLVPKEASFDADARKTREREMVRLFLGGSSIEELARKYRLSDRRVAQIVTRSRIAREMREAILASYQADVRRIMSRMLERLEEDVQSEDPTVRHRAMKLSIDLYKLLTPEGTFADKVNIHANVGSGDDGRREVMELMRQVYGNLKDAASAAGVIDAEVVDDDN